MEFDRSVRGAVAQPRWEFSGHRRTGHDARGHDRKDGLTAALHAGACSQPI